jgi:hypothetical protein
MSSTSQKYKAAETKDAVPSDDVHKLKLACEKGRL